MQKTLRVTDGNLSHNSHMILFMDYNIILFQKVEHLIQDTCSCVVYKPDINY